MRKCQYFAKRKLNAKPEDFFGRLVDAFASFVDLFALFSCVRGFSSLYDDKLEGKPSFRVASASCARSTAERQASSKAVFGRFGASR
jgi:hypothetical protein